MQLDRFLRAHDPIRFAVDIMKCSITQVVLQGLRYFQDLMRSGKVIFMYRTMYQLLKLSKKVWSKMSTPEFTGSSNGLQLLR